MTDKRLGFAAFCFCASIAVALLSPYRTYPFAAFYGDWLVIFGLMVAWVVLATDEKRHSFRVTRTSLLPLAVAGYITVQSFLVSAVSGWDTLLALGYLLAAAWAMMLGANNHERTEMTPEPMRMVVFALVIAGSLSAAFASLQYFGAESWLGSWVSAMPHDRAIRPYANLGQPNQLALLLCMAIAGVWWLYRRHPLGAIHAVALVLCLFWALVLTQSKIGWLILPAFAGLIAWFERGRDDRRVPLRASLALLAAFFAMTILIPEISAALGVQVEGTRQRFASNHVRLVLLQQALQASLDHFWFGAGWFGFGPEQLRLAVDFKNAEYAQHSHNLVLNLAVELGWPFTLFIIGTAALWFYRVLHGKKIDVDVGFAVLVFVAVGVHSAVEFPLWYAYILIPVAWLVGLVDARQGPVDGIRISNQWILAASLVVASALTAVALDYRRVVLSFRALGFESMGWVPDQGSTEKPEWTMFPQYFDYLRFAKIVAKPNMAPEQIAFMEKVAQRFGYGPVLMRMSIVYALNNRDDDAVRAMTIMQRLHGPHYVDAYKNWARLAAESPGSYAAVFRRLPPPVIASR